MEGFRQILRNGTCTISTVPPDRWAPEILHHPEIGMRGKSYTFAAGVLDDIWGFDLSVFGLSPREVLQMDPQQRLLLQTVWEALEDAHLPPASLAGQRVGVYVGASAMDHGVILGHDPALIDAYMMTGNTLSLIANRISHAFDLRGPSFVVDTACSSSLVALDQARRALAAGEIDHAIVAGVSLLLNPVSFAGFSAARMLSPTGLCQPFSDKADGYVRSEGCVALVLQTARTAPARKRAVLIDSDTNADGRTVNVALPSEEGQFQLLERLYQRAGIAPEALDFVEAHGTGTLVGDPIEAHALGRALARQRSAPLPIGSVKSNVGHLEPASGLAGILKTLIAFEDGVLPRSLHAEGLNPHIDFEDLNLSLAREELALTREGGLIAGVSSFGFGGVNAHCILASVPDAPDHPAPAPAAEAPAAGRVLVTSAFCEAALRDLVRAYAGRLNTADALAAGGLVDQAWFGRGLHPQRAGVLIRDPDEAEQALDALAAGQKHPCALTATSRLRDERVVFAYSGNGGQYAGMSRLALEQDAAYRAAYDQIDTAFMELTGWSLKDRLYSATLSAELQDCTLAQALLFADQAAQTLALEARGITADAVLGHSGGEVAAAWACGALDLAQAVELVVHRSRIVASLAGQGTMAALQVSRTEAEALLAEFNALIGAEQPAERLSLAAVNSPRSVTLVGPEPALTKFIRWVKSEHRQACVLLSVNYPYHSAMQDPLEDSLKSALAGLRPSSATKPFYSTALGHRVEGDVLDAVYWWQNLRQPVLFQAAIQAAAADGFRFFLEVGPQPVLNSYISASLEDAAQSSAITHSLATSDPEGVNPMDRAALRAMLHGCRVQEGAYFVPAAGPRLDLPHYPWQQTRMCIAESPEIRRSYGTDDDFHPLLGFATAQGETVWRRDLDDKMIPRLHDHRVGSSVLMPATAFAEIMHAAASRVSGGAPVEITDLDLLSPMVLSASNGVEMQTEADPENRQIWIKSRPRLGQDAFRIHARAHFAILSSPPSTPDEPAPLPLSGDETKGDWTYTHAADLGLHYGPAFQGLRGLRHDGHMVEVFLHDDIGLGARSPISGFDPVQADCLLHGLISQATSSLLLREGLALIPVRIGRLIVPAPCKALASGRIRIRRKGEQSLLVDVTGFDPEGRIVLRFEGLRLRIQKILAPIRFDRHAYHMVARPRYRTPALLSCDIPALRKRLSAGTGHRTSNAEEATLLIEAATIQAIWARLHALADKAGLYQCQRPDHRFEPALLTMLQDYGLSEALPEPGTWKIAPACDLPAPDSIAPALLREQPDRITELGILLHLPEALRALLVPTDPPSPETLFGQEALRRLLAPPSGQQNLLTRALEQICSQHGRDQGCRIGFLGPEPEGLAEFARTHHNCAFLRLLPKGNAASTSSPLYMDLGWDMSAELDILLIADAAELRGDGVAQRLQSAVAPDGVVLTLIAQPSALQLVLRACSSAGAVRAPGSDQCIAQFEALGFKVVLHHDPADAPVSIAIASGTPAKAVQDAQAAPRPALGPTDWAEIWSMIAGPCERAEQGGLDRLCPEASDKALLVHNPAGRSSAELAAAILALRDTALIALDAQRPLIAVLPGGAAYPGCKESDAVNHALWVVMRSIANEYPGLKLRAIDPAALPQRDCATLAQTLDKLLRTCPDDSELVLTEHGALALEVAQGLPRAEGKGPDAPEQTALSLRIDASRRLDDLAWHPVARPAPGPGQVEIEVTATGLNYRDVMWAMGLLPEEALETGFAGPTLGLECAGRVSGVGEGVSGLAPGDPVLAFGPACFSTRILCAREWVVKLPEHLPPDWAAALPVAYFTAYYALVSLGRLSRSDTVLIHGGAGGVGLAAIAIAQMRGATVIATAGSPVKQTLLRQIGVDHVLSSRSTDFVAQVRAITGGDGVDLVLNSLAGQPMAQSLSLLRPFGRFLELGKQDFYANTAIGLRALKDNITYHGIDVDSLVSQRPDQAQAIFAEVMSELVEGRLPMLPLSLFEGHETVEAFRLMQRSGHIGKIVIRPPEIPASGKATPRKQPFEPSRDGWHVIAGGQGGLGIKTAEWLHTRGAMRLALLGRRAEPAPDLLGAINRLRRSGAVVEVLSCDITDHDRLCAVLEQLRQKAPIASVYHAAMVLEDRPLAEIDAKMLARVLPVKTRGLQNLDRATRGDRLEAFVAFTSLAALIGNHGQAAYAAANAFQEAVIRARAHAGLPALAVAWGAITDAGYVARDAALGRMLDKMSGNVAFPVAVALQALYDLLSTPDAGPCVTITPMNWSATLGTLRILRQPSHDLMRRLAEASGRTESTDNLRALLRELPVPKAIKRAAAFLKAEIAAILRISPDKLSTTRPVSDYGMDSLMGVELGLAAQAALGDDLPIPVLGDELSIERIAEMFVRHIQNSADDAPEAQTSHAHELSSLAAQHLGAVDQGADR